MLKIKDSVDLKELEKFGFEFEYGDFNKPINNKVCITINLDTLEIFNGYYPYNSSISTIEKKYIEDLIKANLVEEGE